MRINDIRSGAIVIAGSGMCSGGRIVHHLKYNLWRPECHVVMIGFQAAGTLGRRLVDGAERVRLFQETIKVQATIHTVGGLSAHADQAGLLAWYGAFRNRPPVNLVHGEPAVQHEAISFLQNQPWPGNVRELQNVVRQALLLARPFPVNLEHVKQILARTRKPLSLAGQTHAAYVADLLARAHNGEVDNAYWKMIQDLEPELFTQAIRLAGGNQAKAARWLGVTRLKMREKLVQLGLHPGT